MSHPTGRDAALDELHRRLDLLQETAHVWNWAGPHHELSCGTGDPVCDEIAAGCDLARLAARRFAAAAGLLEARRRADDARPSEREAS